MKNNIKIWQYNNFSISYIENYDGGGRYLSPYISDFIRKYAFFKNKNVKAFEWCSGFGFIGFALLSEGLCNDLCLADINPWTIKCIKKTIYENRLEDKVSCYLSDNFQEIPTSESFDLVIANPPNFYIENSDRLSLCSCDNEWKLHRSFYSNIINYLEPDGLICISEVEPYMRYVFFKNKKKLYDIRPTCPIDEFKRMINENGLTFVDAIPYATLEEGFKMWMVISKKKKADKITKNYIINKKYS